MRALVGRVVIAETGIGIQGLTVVAVSTAAGAAPQRFGSVLTDAAGAFRIEFDGEGGVRVAVFADAATADFAQALYAEPLPGRSGGAALESYSIRIPQADLVKSSVPTPVEATDPAVHAGGQYALRLQVGGATNVLTARVGQQIIEPQGPHITQFGDDVRADLRNRGRAFPGVTGQTVSSRLLQVFQQSLASRFANSSRRARVSMSSAERAGLPAPTATDKSVASNTAEPMIFGNGAVDRYYASLLAPACRDMRLPATKCGDGSGSGGGSGGTNGAPSGPSTVEDAVWRALATTPGLGGTRPGPDDVARRISGLQLASGPADVTAIHDFDVLQIAFDHVWNDLVDERVVTAATWLNQAVTRAGGAPSSNLPPGTIAFSLGIPNPIDVVLDAAKTVTHAIGGVLTGGGGGGGNWGGPTRDHRGNGGAWGGPTRDHRGSVSVGTSPPGQGTSVPDPAADVQQLLSDLEALLAEPYRFTVYAADETGVAINFGLMIKYRQRWTPVTYQAGKLVRTVTLAPKEERAYSRKTTTVTKKKTDTKEKFRSLTKTEENVTDRAVRDIVEKAGSRTGFEAGASGTGYSVKANHDADQSSSDSKQSFHEAVRKAAAEYENEHSMEISFEESVESIAEESGKIVNPNSELAVTYLFYQLQRRFLVSERIQQLTPVVLVAQAVPKPSDINVKWMLQYDWILRKALLDPGFESAFQYVDQDLAGEEFAIAVLKQNVEAQQLLVSQLKDNLAAARNDITFRYEALERALAATPSGGSGGLTFPLAIGLFNKLFGSDSNNDNDTIQMREQIARDAYDRAVDAERSLEDQLSKEASLLTVMTDKWVEAQKKFFDKSIEVDRLRLHIKQNILYYMQAIWDHEPPDQRYFRLHRVPVPVLAGELKYNIVEDTTAIPMPPLWTTPTTLEADASGITTTGDTVPLVEIADLDNPLGYKGNYMIFPLVESNVLTKYMMVPYANRASGIHDPDQMGNLTRAELDDYVCCLKKNLSDADFNALLPGINEAYQRLLSDPHPSEEEIVVPTDSLYIETLPSAQPVLEDFQLMHRAADVERVKIQNAGASLENVRHAARILGGTLASDFDKSVLVQGTRSVTVEDGEGGTT